MNRLKRYRDRNDTLIELIPKLFGTLNDRGGRVDGFPSPAVVIGGQVTVAGMLLGADRVILSVYQTLQDHTVKVFSAHVTDAPQYGDPKFFRYLNGTLGLMSWRRGDWEDTVLADPANSLSVSEAFVRGVFSKDGQVIH